MPADRSVGRPDAHADVHADHDVDPGSYRDCDHASRRRRRAVPVAALVGLALLVAWFQAGRPALPPYPTPTHRPAVLAQLELPTAALTDDPALADPGRARLDGLPVPLPPDDAGDERLLPAVDPGPGRSYAFMQVSAAGEPLRVDPCRPLHYVVRTEGMPAEVLDAIRTAVRTVSSASGIGMVEDGAVDEAPSVERPVLQPDRYPGRWVPVLFAWSTPVEHPTLTVAVAGLGGGEVVDLGSPGSGRIVTGAVVLNADVLSPHLDSARGREYVALVVTHELAHVVGLAHVDDREELMDARPITVDGLGPGDRAGLAVAGQGACHDDT